VAQATDFEVVLGRQDEPPAGYPVWHDVSTTPDTCLPSGSDKLILNALRPLKCELDAALTGGDQDGALRLAYRALSSLCVDLAAGYGELCSTEQVPVHALLIELQNLPDESRFDGTLVEGGTVARLKYRSWLVERNQAAIMAEALIQRCQGSWPNVAVLV
jgi:hypothetical protein